MNVYDMHPEPNNQWVHFYTRNNLATPLDSKDEAAFFAAHPHIAVMRNNKDIPRGTKQKLGDYSNLSHDIHPVFSHRAKQLLALHLQGLGQWIELTLNP
ncbi:MAG: hypothetical protein LH480_16090 [Rubrivivax sp.]|nr:hypothetical protein [Rubrivivax sp.]